MAATRIDCDIHPAVGGTRTTLLPYLDDHWKEQVVSRAIDGLDLTSYPPNMPLSGRPDWRPKDGKPGSDLRCCSAGRWTSSARRMRSATCSMALRRCTIPIWRPPSAGRSTTGSRRNGCARSAPAGLDRGADAGAGSRRRGNRTPRRRQQFRVGSGAGAGREPLGRRHFWPVYQAAEKHKLPIAIHAGSRIARRRARSAGRPIASNIISPRRRRFRPSYSA